uniref:Expressed protein n=1 Tax=Oryza sativa subsp. japonica TaxID=39947 RepID=Q7XGT2_ORYSJ|nr:expressed protein [Oryza sativa Japonica Group]
MLSRVSRWRSSAGTATASTRARPSATSTATAPSACPSPPTTSTAPPTASRSCTARRAARRAPGRSRPRSCRCRQQRTTASIRLTPSWPSPARGCTPPRRQRSARRRSCTTTSTSTPSSTISTRNPKAPNPSRIPSQRHCRRTVVVAVRETVVAAPRGTVAELRRLPALRRSTTESIDHPFHQSTLGCVIN